MGLNLQEDLNPLDGNTGLKVPRGERAQYRHDFTRTGLRLTFMKLAGFHNIRIVKCAVTTSSNVSARTIRVETDISNYFKTGHGRVVGLRESRLSGPNMI